MLQAGMAEPPNARAARQPVPPYSPDAKARARRKHTPRYIDIVRPGTVLCNGTLDLPKCASQMIT